jgi:glycosyltransferase involved in cell wall biosynthesis
LDQVTVVIPTANEEESAVELIQELSPYKNLISEILVVDYKSSDRTLSKYEAAGAHVVREPAPGKGIAIRRGVEESSTKFVVIMDGDGSHKASELPRIINNLSSGFVFVKGSRELVGGGSNDMSVQRRFLNLAFTTLTNLFYGSHYTDLCYGYMAFAKEAFVNMNPEADGSAIDVELCIRARKLRYPSAEFPSFEEGRKGGRPRINVFTAGAETLIIIFGERISRKLRLLLASWLRHDLQLR